MDLTHRFSIPVSVEQAWRALNHLELIDECFPGLTIDEVAGDAFTGSIKVKVGPIGLVYAGSGRYVERDSEAHRLVLESSGTDRRGNGTAEARMVAALTGNGEGTEVDLTTDLTVTGKPAQFGADVIAHVSDKLMAQFASCTASRLAEGFVAPPVPAAHRARPAAEPEEDEVSPTLDGEEESVPVDAVEELEPVDTIDALEETIELGVVPEELDGPMSAEVPQFTAPATPPPPPPGPYRYTPPSDLSEPDARVVGSTLVAVLRRHGPGLGVGFLAAFVLITIINRVRNR